MVEKIAIVTAGGSGLGAAAARRLAKEGFKIAVLSSSGKGEALANELGGFGVTGSNQSPEDLKRLVDATLKRWGRIDALVNSAAHPALRFSTSPTMSGAKGWTFTLCVPSDRHAS
jgi:NAD(P)-dependent dehydrogenase (short-subunit alcohol dehydrogenase family)